MLKFVILFLFITIPVYGNYLGEYEQGENVYIFAIFSNANGGAATNASSGRVSLWDKNDASAPTSSAPLVYWGAGENGLYGMNHSEIKLTGFATGPIVAKCSATVEDEEVAVIHNLLLLDSGLAPNKRFTDNYNTKVIIATAMRDIDVATVSSVRGSVVRKIDDMAATGQLVWATIPNVRSDHEDIEDEIRRNR